MADFKKAFEFMILNEDPHLTGKIYLDNNGALVRYGVNAAANPSLVQMGYYSQNPDGTPKMPNAKALIVAENLYNTRYWRAVKGDDLISQIVADKMFDCQVNTGDAPKLLQHYLHGINQNIVVDGIIGPKSLALTNSIDEKKVLIGLMLWWNWYITQEILNKPQDKKYEKNWRHRANEYPPLV